MDVEKKPIATAVEALISTARATWLKRLPPPERKSTQSTVVEVDPVLISDSAPPQVVFVRSSISVYVDPGVTPAVSLSIPIKAKVSDALEGVAFNVIE